MSENFHIPVLQEETLENLVTNKNGIYVDLTFGGGGHSQAILKALDTKGKVIAFDHDNDAAENAKEIQDPRFHFCKSNFKYFHHFLEFLELKKVDGIFADLGISSHQIDTAERGFSIRFSGKLDMRMNQSTDLTAHHIINKYSQSKLEEIFRNYGEIEGYKKLVAAILHYRKLATIETTDDFSKIIKETAHHNKLNKNLAQAFQAVRIEVNGELSALQETLTNTIDYLNSSGRLVIISYHSLEDRIVKRFIQNGGSHEEPQRDLYGNRDLKLQNIAKKVIMPTENEIELNIRSRSAKMRVGEKI